MLVKEIMSQHPDWISPETTLRQAAQEMADFDVGFLVVGDGTNFQGVITDRDLALKGLGGNLDPEITQVSEIFTPHFYSVHEDDDLRAAAEQMEQYQIRRLGVLNEKQEICGVISLSDIALRGDDQALSNEILYAVASKKAA